MKTVDRLIVFTATGFYSGKVPAAPGTVGSAVGLVFCYLLSRTDGLLLAGCLAGALLLSIGIAGRAEALIGKKDPGEIVIDEMVGMLFTLATLPFTAGYALAGFLLFRLLDIHKPFPIGYLEKRFSGGLGIVIDDAAAGVLANLVLQVLHHTVW